MRPRKPDSDDYIRDSKWQRRADGLPFGRPFKGIMHQALSVPDVFRMIVVLLDLPSLAKLARSCKVLFPSVVEVLWQQLPSLEVFVPCLNSLVLASKLGSPEAFGRLQLYRNAVRCLSFTSPIQDHSIGDALQVPLKLLKAVASSEDQPVLPRLRETRMELYNAAHTPAVFTILSRSVRRISTNLVYEMSPDDATCFGSQIASSCPELEDLELYCPRLRTILPLTKLPLESMYLTMLYVSESEVDVLASMERLRHLKIVAEIEDPVICPRTDPLPRPRSTGELGYYSGFKSLDSLSIKTAVSLYLVISLVRRVTEDGVLYLQVDAECHSPRLLGAFIGDVSSRCGRLETFIWHARSRGCTNDKRQRNWDNTLFPLWSLRHLTSFQFSSSSATFAGAFVFSDIDLERISAAWPRLHTLRLIMLIDCYEYKTEKFKPQMTLSGLTVLAQNCRELKLVQVELDGNEGDMNLLAGFEPNPALDMLCCAWIQVADDKVDCVARFIHDLWPNANIGWGHWYGGQLEDPADNTNHIINRFPALHDESYEDALRVVTLLADSLLKISTATGKLQNPKHEISAIVNTTAPYLSGSNAQYNFGRPW